MKLLDITFSLFLNSRGSNKILIDEDMYFEKDTYSLDYLLIFKKGRLNIFDDVVDKNFSFEGSLALFKSLEVLGYSEKNILLAIEIFKWSILSFVHKTEIQYYENQFLKNFFLIQLLYGDRDNHLYNLKSYFKYSYMPSDISENINLSNGVVLVENENLIEIIECILGLVFKEKSILKFFSDFFNRVFYVNKNNNKDVLFDCLSCDELSKYVIWNKNIISKNKYLEILLKCVNRNQSTINIVVSKLILNGFLHYVLRYAPNFLFTNEKKLVKLSGDKEIVRKIYAILYYLNQVKMDFWKDLNVDYEDFYIYKNELIYYLEADDQGKYIDIFS